MSFANEICILFTKINFVCCLSHHLSIWQPRRRKTELKLNLSTDSDLNLPRWWVAFFGTCNCMVEEDKLTRSQIQSADRENNDDDEEEEDDETSWNGIFTTCTKQKTQSNMQRQTHTCSLLAIVYDNKWHISFSSIVCSICHRLVYTATYSHWVKVVVNNSIFKLTRNTNETNEPNEFCHIKIRLAFELDSDIYRTIATYNVVIYKANRRTWFAPQLSES